MKTINQYERELISRTYSDDWTPDEFIRMINDNKQPINKRLACYQIIADKGCVTYPTP